VSHPSNNQSQNIDEIFSYHAPNETQREKYSEIRKAARNLAKVIIENTPQCADQSAAIRKLREAVMFANTSVALEETQIGPT
jgi:hypothetical protein